MGPVKESESAGEKQARKPVTGEEEKRQDKGLARISGGGGKGGG